MPIADGCKYFGCSYCYQQCKSAQKQQVSQQLPARVALNFSMLTNHLMSASHISIMEASVQQLMPVLCMLTRCATAFPRAHCNCALQPKSNN